MGFRRNSRRTESCANRLSYIYVIGHTASSYGLLSSKLQQTLLKALVLNLETLEEILPKRL